MVIPPASQKRALIEFVEQLNRISFFEVATFRSEVRLSTDIDIKVINMDRSGTHTWKYRLSFDDDFLHNVQNPYLEIKDRLYETCARILKSVPEHMMGKYPATRFYAELNRMTSMPWLFNPERKVEGWLHNKYRGKNPRDEFLVALPDVVYEYDGTLNSPVFDEEDDEDDLSERLKGSLFMKNTSPITNKDFKDVKKMATEAKKKKKVKIQAPKIDPNKVKKPRCNVHTDEPMRFDPVKQKWRCTRDGCKVTARPVKDEDDRSVQVGKGATSLRIVADGNEIVVLLISDDNLALDITPMIDVQNFVETTGILELAKTASKNGTEMFTETTARDLLLSMQVGIIGATDLVDFFE